MRAIQVKKAAVMEVMGRAVGVLLFACFVGIPIGLLFRKLVEPNTKIVSSNHMISFQSPIVFAAASNQLTFGVPISEAKGIAKPALADKCSITSVGNVDPAGKMKSDYLYLLCSSSQEHGEPLRWMIEGSLVDAKNVSFGVQLAKLGDQWVLPKGTVLNFQVSKEAKL